MGGGGTSCSSPEAPVNLNGSVSVRSNSKPNKTVSFKSASKGTEGVEVSSRVRLYQESKGEAESDRLPRRPTSEDVLSPTKSNNREGSQLRRTTVKEPGGLRPGKGRYGDVSLTSPTVLAFASSERM